MTLDHTYVEVTCVTLRKDHCVQVPWDYINVWDTVIIFVKIPHTTYIHSSGETKTYCYFQGLHHYEPDQFCQGLCPHNDVQHEGETQLVTCYCYQQVPMHAIYLMHRFHYVLFIASLGFSWNDGRVLA